MALATTQESLKYSKKIETGLWSGSEELLYMHSEMRKSGSSLRKQLPCLIMQQSTLFISLDKKGAINMRSSTQVRTKYPLSSLSRTDKVILSFSSLSTYSTSYLNSSESEGSSQHLHGLLISQSQSASGQYLRFNLVPTASASLLSSSNIYLMLECCSQQSTIPFISLIFGMFQLSSNVNGLISSTIASFTRCLFYGQIDTGFLNYDFIEVLEVIRLELFMIECLVTMLKDFYCSDNFLQSWDLVFTMLIRA